MSATLIDGKAFAEGLRSRVADAAKRFQSDAGRAPGLVVVLVGEDPASSVYVRSKGKACREAGMESIEHRLPETASQEELIALVKRLNADDKVAEDEDAAADDDEACFWAFFWVFFLPPSISSIWTSSSTWTWTFCSSSSCSSCCLTQSRNSKMTMQAPDWPSCQSSFAL